MELLGKDDIGRPYYWTCYSGDPRALSWKKRRFDAGIFVCPAAADEDVKSCIKTLVEQNNDWICTYGRDAERWHDYVDLASVEVGRQKRVDDGNPMTAWFDDVIALKDLDISACFGAYSFLLILIGCKDKELKQLDSFRRKLKLC